MQTIFVIGSNSFSGATFTNFALQQGARVLGISRSHEPIDAFLPYKWHDHANFKFYPLDLNVHLAEITALIKEVKPAYVVNTRQEASSIRPSAEAMICVSYIFSAT